MQFLSDHVQEMKRSQEVRWPPAPFLGSAISWDLNIPEVRIMVAPCSWQARACGFRQGVPLSLFTVAPDRHSDPRL